MPEYSFWRREIGYGSLMIVVIIASSIPVFLLFKVFSDYPFQINIIFALIMLTLISILLRVFKPQIVNEALRIFKDITKIFRNTNS